MHRLADRVIGSLHSRGNSGAGEGVLSSFANEPYESLAMRRGRLEARTCSALTYSTTTASGPDFDFFVQNSRKYRIIMNNNRQSHELVLFWQQLLVYMIYKACSDPRTNPL